MLHHCFLLNRTNFFLWVWDRPFPSTDMKQPHLIILVCAVGTAVRFTANVLSHCYEVLTGHNRPQNEDTVDLMWWKTRFDASGCPAGNCPIGYMYNSVELHRKAESMDRYTRKEISTRLEKRDIGTQWSLHCGTCILIDTLFFF